MWIKIDSADFVKYVNRWKHYTNHRYAWKVCLDCYQLLRSSYVIGDHHAQGHTLIEGSELGTRVGILKYSKKSSDGTCIKGFSEARSRFGTYEMSRLRGTVIGSDCAKDLL